MIHLTVELGELIAAGGALAGGMIWMCKVFTNPLKETLTMVNSTLIELDKTIQGEREHRHDLEKDVQCIKDTTKENTRRIEDIEEHIEKITGE